MAKSDYAKMLQLVHMVIERQKKIKTHIETAYTYWDRQIQAQRRDQAEGLKRLAHQARKDKEYSLKQAQAFVRNTEKLVKLQQRIAKTLFRD